MSTSHHDGHVPYDRGFFNELEKMQKAAEGFPRGKVKPSDEGALTYGVALDEEKQIVVLQFPKPVGWIGFSRKDALELASKLKNFGEALTAKME